jgi:lysophospholipid acyltransferase (LPLAT)-like uncharacterized protein
MLWVLYLFCFLLSLTWRVRIVGMDRRRRAVQTSRTRSFLLASFHEHAAAGILTHKKQNICTMVSQSKDGEIVAFICSKIGLKTVRGSSSRGSKSVRDAMIDMVKQGTIGAITVDGPRGPRRVLKAGIVDIASKTGALIVPITSVGNPTWTLAKTWDQTKIPKPFCRVLVHYGEPIEVDSDLSEAAFAERLAQVTKALNQDDEMLRLRFEEYWDKGLSRRQFDR